MTQSEVPVGDIFKESYQELFEDAFCAHITWLPDGTIVRANPTFARWLGVSLADIINKRTFQSLLTKPFQIYHDTHFHPLLLIQNDVKEVQLSFNTQSNGSFPTLIYAKKVEAKLDDLPYFFRATLFDIRQRKLYEQQLLEEKRTSESLVSELKHAQAELERFTYVVSHDLKSPLAAIVGLSNTVNNLYKQKKFDKMGEGLIYIKSSAQRLLRYIDGVLTYYKTTTLDVRSTEVIDVRALLLSILQLFPNEPISHNLENFSFKVKASSPLLQQIFMNLLSNAIKYNDKDILQLTFEGDEDASHYHFVVQDNGRGMKDNELKKVFTLFQSSQTKDKFNQFGTGIGLATVKSLIERANGKISIASEFGKGTRVSFSIKKQSEG